MIAVPDCSSPLAVDSGIHVEKLVDDRSQMIVTDSIFVHTRDDVVDLLRRPVRKCLQCSSCSVVRCFGRC